MQLDRYARDAASWLRHAHEILDAARVLFTHPRSITLCFPAAILGHHAIEALLKAALVKHGMAVFDHRKLDRLDADSKLDRADCVWGYNLEELSAKFAKKRADFDVSAVLIRDRWLYGTMTVAKAGRNRTRRCEMKTK